MLQRTRDVHAAGFLSIFATDKMPLLQVLQRTRDVHAAGFLSIFATENSQMREGLLGMAVSERGGFLGVSTLHLRNARTAVSQIYEQNGALCV